MPLRSRNAFRPTVVPWTRNSIPPSSGTNCSSPSRTPSAGLAGVESTLPEEVPARRLVDHDEVGERAADVHGDASRAHNDSS